MYLLAQCGRDPRRCAAICRDEYWTRNLGDRSEGRWSASSICKGRQNW